MTNLKWLDARLVMTTFALMKLPKNGLQTAWLGRITKSFFRYDSKKKYDLFPRNLSSPSFWNQQRLATSQLRGANLRNSRNKQT